MSQARNLYLGVVCWTARVCSHALSSREITQQRVERKEDMSLRSILRVGTEYETCRWTNETRGEGMAENWGKG